MSDALSKGIKHIYLEPGVHILTGLVRITEDVTISGAGRGITFVQGNGFLIKRSLKGNKGKRCTFMDITVQKTEQAGLNGYHGMPFDCLRMHFDQCGCGVVACYTKGRLTNCQITQSKKSGVYSYYGTIEIEGKETTIEKNNTSGKSYYHKWEDYGLRAHSSSSFIHILSPLTKESISKNNQNGNYGGDVDNIKTVQSFPGRTRTKNKRHSPFVLHKLLAKLEQLKKQIDQANVKDLPALLAKLDTVSTTVRAQNFEERWNTNMMMLIDRYKGTTCINERVNS